MIPVVAPTSSRQASGLREGLLPGDAAWYRDKPDCVRAVDLIRGSSVQS
ncbi:MAG: hypothetical protein ABI824_07835 [Acidobacteriota bacterium]